MKSVINLNIQQPAEKSKFIFYSDREYERLYGWEKQRQTDKTHAWTFAKLKNFAEPQEARSLPFLEELSLRLTNCEKLILKYLLSMLLTSEKNQQPLQVKNQTIADEIGCSIWSVQQANRKFRAAKLFVTSQSNKYAVPVYASLIDKKTRGILYNLCNDTTPHILKIKEPTKALKKSPYTLYRESIKAKKFGYPHIHNLPSTDIIGDLFINPVLSVGVCNKSNNLNTLQSNNLISKGSFKTPELLKTEILRTHTQIIADKIEESHPKCYNEDNTKAQEAIKITPNTHQTPNTENEQESTKMNDFILQVKLIDQAKKMYPEPSLNECGGDYGVFSAKLDERTRCVRNKINELFKQNGIR